METFLKVGQDYTSIKEAYAGKDYVKIYHGSREKITEVEQIKILQSENDIILQ